MGFFFPPKCTECVKLEDDGAVGRTNLARRDLAVGDSSAAPGWEISEFHAHEGRDGRELSSVTHHGEMLCLVHGGVRELLAKSR